jgi:hypothetical protein
MFKNSWEEDAILAAVCDEKRQKITIAHGIQGCIVQGTGYIYVSMGSQSIPAISELR